MMSVVNLGLYVITYLPTAPTGIPPNGQLQEAPVIEQLYMGVCRAS